MKQEAELLDVKKDRIQVKGLNKIEEYFDLELEELENLDVNALKHLNNMARLGMQFEREANLSKRATESNYIRIGKLLLDTKEEMKRYLKHSLPKYCNDL